MSDAVHHRGPDTTVIEVAHDLEVARRADRVIVMENGRIAEDGAPQVLARSDGPFRRLANSPLGGALP